MPTKLRMRKRTACSRLRTAMIIAAAPTVRAASDQKAMTTPIPSSDTSSLDGSGLVPALRRQRHLDLAHQARPPRQALEGTAHQPPPAHDEDASNDRVH